MSDSLPGQNFEIGLASWIIQDGNYGDFNADQNAEFALEFYCDSAAKSLVPERSFHRLEPAKYQINGEVAWATDKLWVLDFGIRAFQERKPLIPVIRGDFISAEI